MSKRRTDARRCRAAIALVAVLVAAVAARVAAGSGTSDATVPKGVQQQLHQSAAGFFGSNRAFVAQRARVLAQSRDATLYGIHDHLGNYCIELLGARKGLSYGTSCRPGIRIGTRSVTGGEVDSPVTSIVVDGVEPPVIHFGRLATGTVAARALFADGSRQKIPIGTDGFFVYEPSPGHMDVSRRGVTVIQLLEPDGTPLTYQLLPEQPVTSIGKHYERISGRVVIDGAAMVQVTVGINRGRGRTVDVPLSGGRFTWSGRALEHSQVPALVVLDDLKRPLTNIVSPLPEPTWRRYVADARRAR
jgi:hypothetical protein